jgi:hypothetical protein
MPFDGTGFISPPLQVVGMIDALLDYFGPCGERWLKGAEKDGDRRCVMNALRHFRRTMPRANRTTRYFRIAMAREGWPPMENIEFNDHPAHGWHHMQALLLSAREIAMADATGQPRPTGCFMRELTAA